MQQNLLQLDGRIVIVAGAGGGGLGTTVTRLAANAGATVIGVSRRKENLDEHLGRSAAAVVDGGASPIEDDGLQAWCGRHQRLSRSQSK